MASKRIVGSATTIQARHNVPSPEQITSTRFIQDRLVRKALSPPAQDSDPYLRRRLIGPQKPYHLEPVWRSSNNEYGISNEELLDYIMSQRLNVRVGPAELCTEMIVQRPKALQIPFLRKAVVRSMMLGGAEFPGTEKLVYGFDIPDKINQSHNYIVRGVDAAASLFLYSIPLVTGYPDDLPFELRYIPEGHWAYSLAKSYPALAIVQSSRTSKGGQKSIYRSVERKLLRRGFFDEWARLQGISREFGRWGDIISFEPDHPDSSLWNLLQTTRSEQELRHERRDRLEAIWRGNDEMPDEAIDQSESFLVKRDRRYFRGIDGIFNFSSRPHVKSTAESCYEAGRAAVRTVLSAYGYVSLEMQAGLTPSEQSSLTEEERNAYKRTKSISELWVSKMNYTFLRYGTPAEVWLEIANSAGEKSKIIRAKAVEIATAYNELHPYKMKQARQKFQSKPKRV
ncbi:uncharacterized protein V1516DRAFT_672411 [Lipomyces oligophaga]|uniref:uncharacterized protein n=1 Tax=Lipomyces oligophaga TaxID=45792 RepID=UPI0034CF3470